MGLEGFERGARMTFSFPRLKLLTLLTVATLAAALYVGCSLAYLLYITVILPVLLKLSAPRLINPRRALGLTPFFLAWSSLATILRGYSSLLLTPPTLLISMVTRFLSNKRLCPLLVFASSLVIMLLERANATTLTIHSLLFTTIMLSTEVYILKLKQKLHDFGGTEALTAYLNYALGGAKEQLVNLLARMSVVRTVPVYALDLLDGSNTWGIVVIPHVHPGPFKSFGSSRLPRMFVDEAKKRGLFCMVLHGASTHHEDLAREEDAETLVNQVIEGCGETLCVGTSIGVAERSNGVHRALALALEGGWSLAIVERVDGGMEDVPLEIMGALGPKVVLVDAHNSHDNPRPSPLLGDPLGESLIESANSAIQAAREKVASGWQVSVAQRPGSLGSELGGAGVSVLQLQHESGMKLLIASFDANNMVRAARDTLYSELREPNTITMVATTDTHELTGARAGSTYEPLGTSQDARVYVQLLRSLLQNATQPRTLYYRLRMLSFTSSFLDQDALQKLNNAVSEMITRAILLFTLCFATFLIPLLPF